MDRPRDRGLVLAGGLCGILWPLLSIAYYAAYPIAAGGAMLPQPEGQAGFATRVAELGQRPSVVSLEWAYAALPLLLWPFLAALHRRLNQKGQGNLSLVALGLGVLGMGLMVLSGTFNPMALHSLGQAHVSAGSDTEAAAVLVALTGLLHWMRGINQVSSLLYQGYVALASLALIQSRTWRFWGWLGLAGAILALPAKLSLGLRVPTNAIWTGLAYGVWPIALGVGLLRHRRS